MTRKTLTRSDAAPAQPGAAARALGDLLSLMGGGLLVVAGLATIAGATGLVDSSGLDLSNGVLYLATLLAIALGVGLRVMEPKS